MRGGAFHYTEAERLIKKAGEVMNADYGWMASLSSSERLQWRNSYLDEANARATLADAAATAEASPRLVHNHNDRPSAWWTALHGEERT